MKKNYLIIVVDCLLTLFIIGVAGCKKDAKTLPDKLAAASNVTSTIPDSMTITPEGLLPKSHVHLIENGYHLQITGGHVIKINTVSGRLMADFGKINMLAPNPATQPQTPSSPQLNQNTRALNSTTNSSLFYSTSPNWQTYSQWQNTTSQAITEFSTAYVVPGQPVNASDSQVISIWEGLAQLNNSDIMQPVLAWGGGHMAGGGGNYWTIANWYVWTDGVYTYAAYTAPIQVNSGTSLTAVITLTGQTNGSNNYTVAFNGYNNPLYVVKGDQYNGSIGNSTGTVTIPTIPQEVWAYEVLETYNFKNGPQQHDVYQVSDYPAAADVRMTGIDILTGGSSAPLSWAAEIGTTAYFGENTYIVNNNSQGNGEVDLYFRTRPAPVITYTTPVVATKGTAISPLVPANTGGPATSYSVTPALPAGLTLDPAAGIINGTPTVTAAAANYKVTATNTTGSGYFYINITVNAPQVAINGTGSVNWYNGNGSGSGTITAPASYLVHVTVSAYGLGTLTNFTMNGATLSGPMGNSIYIQNSSTTQTFTMPPSGSVTWSGYFQRSGQSGTGGISVY